MVLGALVLEPPDVNTGQPNGRGHPIAILIKISKRCIGLRVQVHLDSVDHIMKVLSRDGGDANRVVKSGMEGVAVVAIQGALKSLAPVQEQGALFFCRAGTVAEVICQAQKGVQGAYRLPLAARQDPKSVIKIPRLAPGYLLTVTIGIG